MSSRAVSPDSLRLGDQTKLDMGSFPSLQLLLFFFFHDLRLVLSNNSNVFSDLSPSWKIDLTWPKILLFGDVWIHFYLQ